jgi:hypothetical protein
VISSTNSILQQLAEEVYSAYDLDWFAYKKDNKEIVDKTIDIILDLFPTVQR